MQTHTRCAPTVLLGVFNRGALFRHDFTPLEALCMNVCSAIKKIKMVRLKRELNENASGPLSGNWALI
jgi:hypothetical protein